MDMAIGFFAAILIVCLTPRFALASDPSPLQDFCVAVNDSNASVFVNGKICKDPNKVVADDFYYSAGLNKAGNTANPLGFGVNLVTDQQFPGLNTLGISGVRVDFAPKGVVPPHIHPRASEIIVVLQGSLYVGFVTSNPDDPKKKNKLFAKTLNPGDAFVFPQGLIHFQLNVGKTNAVSFSALGSQNPGFTSIPSAVFHSDPPINKDVLAKSF